MTCKSWFTYCEDADGIEREADVQYYVSPAEPEVNWHGSLDIESVLLDNVWVDIASMHEDILDDLLERTIEHENETSNPDNY